MESIAKSLNPVNPVLPVAPYIGGKRCLAKRVITRINATEHMLYAEPFVGMGGIFLRRNYRPRGEVINDYSGEVMNLFRVAQRHYADFMGMLRYQLTSRSEFERLKATKPETLTDMERAARFLYLQRTSFGGKVAGQNYGVCPDRPARFDVRKLRRTLEDLHERLTDVSIENLPYGTFIKKYDRKHTLFYLDPPYYNNEEDYGKDMFSKADFDRLASLLGAIKGRFIMSLNDVPEVREIFSAFDMEAVDTTYSLSKNSSKRVGEVIITN